MEVEGEKSPLLMDAGLPDTENTYRHNYGFISTSPSIDSNVVLLSKSKDMRLNTNNTNFIDASNDNERDQMITLSEMTDQQAVACQNDEGASSASKPLFDVDGDFTNGVSHCHSAGVDIDEENHRARRILIIASCLCLSFMIAEVIGGYLAGSLAIMTDAAHLLTDFASFLISLFSIYVASRPATRQMSFGWHRAEVLGAFISVLLIWIITGVLVYMAIERIVKKTYEIDAKVMLITAAVGVFVNVIMGILLHRGGHHHGHSHYSSGSNTNKASKNGVDHSRSSRGAQYRQLSDDSLLDDDIMVDNGFSIANSSIPNKPRQQNLNVRAAFVHVVGDFFQSVGVLIAAYIIYYHPELSIIDPICTFVFSVVVLVTTLAIMRDAINVLMEGLPKGTSFLEVVDALGQLPGVLRVHNLRIWSLTMNKIALSVHLVIPEDDDEQTVLKCATNLLRTRFGVYDCTVQIEHYSSDMDQCTKCKHPKH